MSTRRVTDVDGFLSKGRRLLSELVVAPLESRAWLAGALVVALMALSTLLVYALGGTGKVPPHWFYFPIALAGARFGWQTAAATGLVAGLLVGPHMPAFVETGTPQPTSDWLIRAAFFASVGALIAVLGRGTIEELLVARNKAAAGRRLDRALSESQLSLYFQPIVAARNGEVVAAEALLRWELPEVGLVSAERVIPLAEATGRIDTIGAWVIEEACASLRAWESMLGDHGFVVSVNVAPAQLHRGDLVDTVLGALDRHRLAGSRLCLELTESTIIEDLPRATRVLTALREAGVSVAIDDFGSGYSSFAYLRNLPYDTIKLDGRLVADLEDDEEAQTLVRSVLRLAHELGKVTVAEQVESGLQWRRLVVSGCTHGQGYLFSPPLPARAFSNLLGSRRLWTLGEVEAGNPSLW